MTTEPATAQGHPEAVDLVVRGGWLLTLNDKREIYRDGLVAVRGSKIVAIGSRKELGDRYRGVVEITAGDQVVMPGMVNGHRHILSGARGAAPEGLVTLVRQGAGADLAHHGMAGSSCPARRTALAQASGKTILARFRHNVQHIRYHAPKSRVARFTAASRSGAPRTVAECL